MSGDELPRDAHLRAALRHAPDRALAPPEALSREILAAARAAVAPPPWPRRVLAKATALLDLLRRPAAGAAFASLVLATVIGLMWRDGPPPEADAPPLRQAAPAETRAEAPSSASAPAGAASPTPPPQGAAAPPAPARTPAAVASRARASAAPLTDARPPAAPPTAAAPAAPAAPADTAAPRAEADTAERAAGAMQKSAARASVDPLAPAVAALDLARDTTDAAALRSADGALAPRADPMRLWLADLQRSARGRWAASDAAPAEPATALPGRDGAALGQVLVAADAAWWQAAEPGARWWRAPLPEADLQRLRTGLATWSAPR